MHVRPLRLLGASRLAALDAALAADVAAWAADWGVDTEVVAHACTAAGEAGIRAGHWRQGWRAGEAAAWLDWPAHVGVEIERAMFAQGQLLAPAQASEPALAPAAAGAALDALLALLADRVCGASTPAQTRAAMSPGQQPEREWLPLSGAVVLQVSIGGAALSCLLNADAVQGLTGGGASGQGQALPGLAALKVSEALGPVPLALPVRLGTVDVDLASLMTVGIGDVIRLDVALDRLLEVSTPDGKPLFAAHLGRSGDQVAIEVAASL